MESGYRRAIDRVLAEKSTAERDRNVILRQLTAITSERDEAREHFAAAADEMVRLGSRVESLLAERDRARALAREACDIAELRYQEDPDSRRREGTRCPTPCQACRSVRGAYCILTPCPCDCHRLAARYGTPGDGRELEADVDRWIALHAKETARAERAERDLAAARDGLRNNEQSRAELARERDEARADQQACNAGRQFAIDSERDTLNDCMEIIAERDEAIRERDEARLDYRNEIGRLEAERDKLAALNASQIEMIDAERRLSAEVDGRYERARAELAEMRLRIPNVETEAARAKVERERAAWGPVVEAAKALRAARPHWPGDPCPNLPSTPSPPARVARSSADERCLRPCGCGWAGMRSELLDTNACPNCGAMALYALTGGPDAT